MSCMRAGEVVVSHESRERAPRTVRKVADKGKVDFAREQRREPTRGEEILWHALHDEKLGAKFRRQHPMKDFVLDFYCAELRLAIELDGASHQGREAYDRWRAELPPILGDTCHALHGSTGKERTSRGTAGDTRGHRKRLNASLTPGLAAE